MSLNIKTSNTTPPFKKLDVKTPSSNKSFLSLSIQREREGSDDNKRHFLFDTKFKQEFSSEYQDDTLQSYGIDSPFYCKIFLSNRQFISLTVTIPTTVKQVINELASLFKIKSDNIKLLIADENGIADEYCDIDIDDNIIISSLGANNFILSNAFNITISPSIQSLILGPAPNLDTEESLIIHIKNHDLKEFRILHEASNLSLSSLDPNGYNSLHYACQYGCLNIVLYILKHSQENTVNIINKTNSTPLHIAVSNNFYDIVDTLLQAGADVELIDGFNEKPIDIALRKGLNDIIDLLN